MFSADRLKNRRTQLNLSQSYIAKQLGVSRASYSQWESGKYLPNKKNLEQLVILLNVESRYFDDTFDIDRYYLKLTELNQKKLFNHAKDLFKSQLFQYKVHAELSAGLGNPYFDEYAYDTVYFDKEYTFDIASWIDGNSMEPKYHHGDVALVSQTGFDYDGLVYAVVYNDETFIKKVFIEKNIIRLVSINTDYADIIAPRDEVRIVGKVVESFTPIEV